MDRTTVQKMYDDWQAGIPKSRIEKEYLGDSASNGKHFTRLVREHLGIETERRHPLAVENERLRGLLGLD